MYDFLKHAHSGLRWLVLIFLVVSIVNALMKMGKKTEYTKADKMPVLLGLIFTHVQIIIGFVLYFISQKFSFSKGMGELMKDSVQRFYAVEHLSMMILAVVLITIGYSRSKRQELASKKHTTVLIFYGIGLALILVSIPWPFRVNLGGGWF
jgi:predicted acyltransferase